MNSSQFDQFLTTNAWWQGAILFFLLMAVGFYRKRLYNPYWEGQIKRLHPIAEGAVSDRNNEKYKAVGC